MGFAAQGWRGNVGWDWGVMRRAERVLSITGDAICCGSALREDQELREDST